MHYQGNLCTVSYTIVFYNLKTFGSHFILEEIAREDGDIMVLPFNKREQQEIQKIFGMIYVKRSLEQGKFPSDL